MLFGENTGIVASALRTVDHVYTGTAAISAVIFATGIVVLVVTTAIRLVTWLKTASNCGNFMYE